MKKHSEKIRTKSLKALSLFSYKNLSLPENLIAPGDKLCCECWISIHKQFKVSNTDDDGSTSSYDNIATRDTSNDHNMDVEVGGEREHSLFDINSTLPTVRENTSKNWGTVRYKQKMKRKEKTQKCH